MSRTPDIVADAAHLVFCQPAKSFTGHFLIDDSFLHETGGVTDFATYSVAPGMPWRRISSSPTTAPAAWRNDCPHLKLADLKP